VADKLLSIVARLAIYALPAGFNPIRQMSLCFLQKRFIASDDKSLETMHFEMLNKENIPLLLSFATSLIEQLPKVKFSKVDRYHLPNHFRLQQYEVCETSA
jgi:hypothetical protein